MNKRALCRLLGGGVAAMLVLSVAAAVPDLPSNKDCLDCHSDKELTKTNAVGRVLTLFVDQAKLTASVHGTNRCVDCHSDLTKSHPDDNAPAQPVKCDTCHRSQSESFGGSVHGLALRRGQAEAPLCKDCHGQHDILQPSSPASPLHFSRLATTCGECHAQAAQDVVASVHGRAAASGNREAATCTDCHSEHKIEALKDGSPLRMAAQICGKCHTSERINTKYRLPTDRLKTFFESYHGLAAQSGSTRAANCASCHGVHKILPSNDPRSSIHPSHLVETCGKCHPGATANFALGKIHLDGARGDDLGTVVNWWVRRVYIGLIIVVVGLLGLHNLLVWMRKVAVAFRTRGRTVQRLDRSQRIQHFILLSSFVILALSGFALKYPDSWLAWMFGANENLRRWIHRVAGVILLALGAYHVLYAALTRPGRALVGALLPRWQDWVDVRTNVRFLLGRRPAKARFGRFGYPEKAEYWAVVWGTIVMGVTGLMIWLKLDVTRWLPRWIVEVATTIHYYEAILACLAIVVWHFYHVILDPDVYPLNWAWWDGKVSAHWYKEEHPLDEVAESTEETTSKPEPSLPSHT